MTSLSGIIGLIKSQLKLEIRVQTVIPALGHSRVWNLKPFWITK